MKNERWKIKIIEMRSRIIKNDKKYRKNKNSMTQNYNRNQIDNKNDNDSKNDNNDDNDRK